MIEDAVLTAPLSLTSIENQTVYKFIENNFLPYSIGMEFECDQLPNYNIDKFKEIFYILDVDIDTEEQRYRIPKGINGLICLYRITQQLKLNTLLNLNSSIHFHVDMTDVWHLMDIKFKDEEIKWVLEHLKTWGTAVDYNYINNWYRWNSLQTLEIRIGEPTFEYEILVKRIIDCCNIVKKLKQKLLPKPELILENIQQQMKEIKLSLEETSQLDNYQNVINSRVIKMY